MKTASNYLSRGPSYSQFCSKIRCHGNRSRQGKILTASSDSSDPKIGGVGANSAQLSFTGTELYHFEIPIGRNAFFTNWGKIREGVIRFLFKQTRSYFSGPESLCKTSSKSNQNCGRIASVCRQTARMTDASDFIIYSNGADNKQTLVWRVRILMTVVISRLNYDYFVNRTGSTTLLQLTRCINYLLSNIVDYSWLIRPAIL